MLADSSKWSILVQNEGEESLKAKIVLPVRSSPDLTLQKHQSQRVSVLHASLLIPLI